MGARPSRAPSGLDADDGGAGRDGDAALGEMDEEARRNAAGKLGRISGTSDTSAKDSPPASKPARATSRAKRRSTEQKLDAAGASADQHQTRAPLALQHARDPARQTAGESRRSA
jgi:hypothetical protein